MLPGKIYKPEDILEILKHKIWVLLLPFAMVSAATALWVHRQPDKFRSETVIMVVPQRVPESYIRSTVTTRIEDRLQSLAQQILSRTRLERIIQELNLYERERRTGIMEDVVEQMRKDIGVEVLRGDSFRISYVGEDARIVMQVTERLASFFIEENLRDREVLADDTNQFLEAQLEDSRRRLVEQEKKVEDYHRRFAGQLPSQLESNLQVIQSAQQQVQAIDESINRDRDRRLILERQIADLEQQPDVITTSETKTVTVTPAQQLAAAQSAMAAMQQRLKPDHPDIQRLSRAIRDLERNVEAEQDNPDSALASRPTVEPREKHLDDLRMELELLDRQLADKEKNEQRIRTQIASYQSRVEAAPSRESEMVAMTRDYETLQAMYRNLLEKKEESKIAANLERRQIGEQFKMLDPARIGQKPFSPNRLRLTSIGMGVGLALGLALVALMEYRDKSFKTDREVTRVLSLPVLAVVPLMMTPTEERWLSRRRLLLGFGCGTMVAACLAVVAYTFIHH